MEKKSLTRRDFIQIGGKVTFGTVVAALLFRGSPGIALAKVVYPEPDYTPLDNACIQARSEEERIVAMIVDTVVPGSESDPSGVPGALDCCALNLIYDAFYPFKDSLDVIIPLVDGMAQSLYDKKFIKCTLEERTAVLRKIEGDLPIMRLAYRFIRSMFYSMSYTMRGTIYMKWPGPNLGYRSQENFSFGEPVSQELTGDGNLP